MFEDPQELAIFRSTLRAFQARGQVRILSDGPSAAVHAMLVNGFFG
jgi:hypothetical protein